MSRLSESSDDSHSDPTSRSPSSSPRSKSIQVPIQPTIPDERQIMSQKLDERFKYRYTEDDPEYRNEVHKLPMDPPTIPDFQGRSYRNERHNNRGGGSYNRYRGGGDR